MNEIMKHLHVSSSILNKNKKGCDVQVGCGGLDVAFDEEKERNFFFLFFNSEMTERSDQEVDQERKHNLEHQKHNDQTSETLDHSGSRKQE